LGCGNGKLWNFYHENWEKRLTKYLVNDGTIHPPMGSDYFIYPREVKWDLPPFAVGRPGWDNWLIYRARVLGIPVINATKAVTAIHQNHNYSHVPFQKDNAWEGPEADWNRKLIGCGEYMFTLLDATNIMTS